MIILDDSLLIGSGNGRATYRHPDDPMKLLKVQHTPVKGRLRWYERPVTIAPSNQREIDGYTQMILAFGLKPDFASKVYGWEETTMGKALVVEDATYDLTSKISMNRVLKFPEDSMLTIEDLEWAKDRYTEIAESYCEHRVFNHGLKPESVLLGWKEGRRVMKLFDFKAIVYRQLISPRFIPRGQHNVQMLTIRSVQSKLDQACDRLKNSQRSS